MVMGNVNIEVEQLIHYIKEMAPLIIHVNLKENLKHFMKDTHYRNCFELEVKTSNYM